MARLGWAVVLVVALALPAAGCGGKSGASQPATANQPPQTPPPPPPKHPGIAFGTQGPWPVQNAAYGGADGLQESPVVAVTTDEAENRWVATARALYVLRPGDKSFKRFDELDGLHLGEITGRSPGPVGWAKYCDAVPIADGAPCTAGTGVQWGGAANGGILSLVGGAPNEVFVGYSGRHIGYNQTGTPPVCPDDPGGVNGFDWCDPDRHTGKVDWVRLNDDGTIQVVRFDFLSNDHGRKFWHDRIVNRLAYDHFVHPRTVYVGTEHGVTQIRPDLWTPFTGVGFDPWIDTWFGDHLHAVVCFHTACDPASSEGQRTGEWMGLAIDADGQLWHAGFFSAGRISWDPDPLHWMQRGGGAFTAAFGDGYPSAPNAAGFDGEPVFKVLQEGDFVQLSGVAVCPDGRVWFSSLGPQNGTTHTVARWTGDHFDTWDATALGLPENPVQDIACLPDGRVVLAGPTSGLLLLDPATMATKSIRAGQGIPSDQVLHVEVDRMTNPPSLDVATAGGAAVLRVLP
jgi:hypothetical protein